MVEITTQLRGSFAVWCILLCFGFLASCQDPVEPSEIGVESQVTFLAKDGAGKAVRGVEITITDLQTNGLVGTFSDPDSIGRNVVSAEINASGRFQWRVQAIAPTGYQPAIIDTTIDIPCANSTQIFQFWQSVAVGCGVDASTSIDHVTLPCIPVGESVQETLSFLITNDCPTATEFTMPAPTRSEYSFSVRSLQGDILVSPFVLQPQESAVIQIDIDVNSAVFVDRNTYTILSATGAQSGSVEFDFSFEVVECQGCECGDDPDVVMEEATDTLCPGEQSTVVFDNSEMRNNTSSECEYTFELIDDLENSDVFTIVQNLAGERVAFGDVIPNVGIQASYDDMVQEVRDTISYQVWLNNSDAPQSDPQPCHVLTYIVVAHMGQVSCAVEQVSLIQSAQADSNLVFHQVMYNCYDVVPDVSKDKTVRVVNTGNCPVTYDIQVTSEYDSLFYFETYSTTRLRGELEPGGQVDGKLSFYPRRNMGVDINDLPLAFFAEVRVSTSGGCDTTFEVVGAADTNKVNCCQKNEFALPEWGATDTEGPLYLGVSFNEETLEVTKVQDQGQFLNVIFAVESVDEGAGTAVLGQAGKPTPAVYYQFIESRPVGANGSPVCSWKREFDPLDCSDAEQNWDPFPEVRAGDLFAYYYEYASGVSVCGLVYVSDISRRTNDRLPDVKLIFPPPDRF